jgi:recombination protein RecR
MSVLPDAFQELIDALSRLPGVGARTAERYAFYIFKNQHLNDILRTKLSQIENNVSLCPVTFALIDSKEEKSRLYTDPSRDKKVIALVAEPFDIVAIEKTGNYKGTYHVLGGLISPIDGINPENLKIDELLSRIKTDKVEELIIALNATVEGESTALYIQKLVPDTTKITRLARGLPVGLDIEYADQITLGRALEGRTTL